MAATEASSPPPKREAHLALTKAPEVFYCTEIRQILTKRTLSTTITEWDWTYRVGYDGELAQRIAAAADQICWPAESALLRAKLDWARAFVSLDRLLEALETGEITPDAVANVDPEKLLHLPQSVADDASKRISIIAKKIGHKPELNQLLRAAVAAPYRPLTRPMLSQVFGNGLDKLLLDAAEAEAFPRDESIKLSRFEARDFVEDFVERAKRDRSTRCIFSNATLQIDYTDCESGFAEYWPRELIAPQQSDLLVIHLNAQSLDLHALEATLYHEIFGHGSFYYALRTLQPPLVDHGALVLVEGWATAIEWHYSSPQYAKWTRARRLRSVQNIDAAEDDLILQIERAVADDNDERNRERRIIEAFQYPGLSMSYAIGGLWFEQLPGYPDLTALSNFLGFRPWGDFMATWSR